MRVCGFAGLIRIDSQNNVMFMERKIHHAKKDYDPVVLPIQLQILTIPQVASALGDVPCTKDEID